MIATACAMRLAKALGIGRVRCFAVNKPSEQTHSRAHKYKSMEPVKRNITQKEKSNKCKPSWTLIALQCCLINSVVNNVVGIVELTHKQYKATILLIKTLPSIQIDCQSASEDNRCIDYAESSTFA